MLSNYLRLLFLKIVYLQLQIVNGNLRWRKTVTQRGRHGWSRRVFEGFSLLLSFHVFMVLIAVLGLFAFDSASVRFLPECYIFGKTVRILM